MAEIDLTKFLDKEHAAKPLPEILDLSPSALKGVTEADAEAMRAAFGIKTIRDMGRHKFFRLAQSLLEMAEFAAKPATAAKTPD